MCVHVQTYGGAGAGVEESEREAVEAGMAALSTEDAEEQMGRVLAEAALMELQVGLRAEDVWGGGVVGGGDVDGWGLWSGSGGLS